jgi:proteasome-associated ATPase
VIASLPPGDPVRRDLLELRPQIFDQQETMVEARRMIEKLEEVIKKVTSPANRIGTFLGATSKDTAHIVVGGADYYCNIDPRISLAKLKKGTRVLVNEAFVIVGDLGFETAGPVTKITEVIGKDRLRVGSEHGLQSMVLQRSADLAHSTLKSGDEVRVARAAVGKGRRTGSGAPGDQRRHRVAALACRSFPKISACHAERISALRSAGLREDAHWQSDRLQFDQAASGKGRY